MSGLLTVVLPLAALGLLLLAAEWDARLARQQTHRGEDER